MAISSESLEREVELSRMHRAFRRAALVMDTSSIVFLKALRQIGRTEIFRIFQFLTDLRTKTWQLIEHEYQGLIQSLDQLQARI